MFSIINIDGNIGPDRVDQVEPAESVYLSIDRLDPVFSRHEGELFMHYVEKYGNTLEELEDIIDMT